MDRPLILRVTPPILRTWLFYKLFRSRVGAFAQLYGGARLSHAKQVTMSLHPGDAISDQIAFTGFYEHSMSRWVAHIGRTEGGLMVDAGANVGYFALVWASASPTNKVIAFEASPRVFPLLESNVDRNPQVASSLTLHNVALGASDGSMTFDLGPQNQDGWGGLTLTPSEVSVEVPVRRLDVELSGVDVTFLKIDVEGADTWVLQGAADLLSNRRIKYVSWEQNFTRMAALGIDEEESIRLVRSYGYSCQPLEKANGKVTQWLATRK